MPDLRDFNVVVFGATGFVGRRIVEYLAKQEDKSVRWAVAGRSMADLEALRKELGLSDAVSCLHADSIDPSSLRHMAERTDVVISVVGPYQRFGTPLVAACVEAGTGYVDLNGEPLWMRQMIDTHEAAAKASGSRIVFSCGFDSIPFEYGVARIQALCTERWGRPASRIAARVVGAKGGGYSAGTIASLKANLAAAAGNPPLQVLLDDPFALTPGFKGPAQPDAGAAYDDPLTGGWVTPHIMAVINVKNVHRSNMLMGFPYGRHFRYDEMVAVAGTGAEAKAAAEAMAATDLLETAPTMNERREHPKDAMFRLLFVADDEEHGRLALTVEGDSDPGYGSTSKMIAQTALCLARDGAWEPGIWTPGALMGDVLLSRLERLAGLTFREVDSAGSS